MVTVSEGKIPRQARESKNKFFRVKLQIW